MIAVALILGLIVFLEMMIIIVLFREYRRQLLKAELLTQMIEGKVCGDGKNTDIWKFEHSS